MQPDMKTITPVILAGGAGKRLWPLSTQKKPKPFLKLRSKTSFLQNTADRAKACADPYVICAKEHKDMALAHVPNADQIILEPQSRNTAPAIAAAAHYLVHNGKEIMLVLPTDHIIKDNEAFENIVAAALPAMEDGKFITFGITPEKPSEHYGYIKASTPYKNNMLHIDQFIEKPDRITARMLMEDDDCFWNSGIFMLRAQDYLGALKAIQPKIYEHSLQAVKKATRANNTILLNHDSFCQCPDISIDYAVMEQAADKVVMPADIDWCDIGTWYSLAKALLKA